MRHITIHHSASVLTTTVADIRAWHVEDNGWDDIGYHFVITQYGAIVSCRDIETQGAHVRGHNKNNIGVCVIGDNTREDQKWTAAQRRSLLRLIEALMLTHNVPPDRVVGHRDWSKVKTQCPGVDVRQMLTLWGLLGG